MALRVWLPLNGNLNNQGLSSVTVTNNGATVNAAGKIGSCYSFGDGTDSTKSKGIQLNSNFTDLTERSICAWIRPKGNHLHYTGTIVSSGNWNAQRWAFGVKQDNSGFTGFGSSFNSYFSTSIPVNQWTHLCVTVDSNGLTKYYKNGEYLGENTQSGTISSDAITTMIGRETYASGYFSFNGDINDVRIYDHVLSIKEVKDIAKGLVLHHKLDDIINTNLLSATPKSYNASAYNAYQLQLSENLQAGQTYTMQLWNVNVSHSGKNSSQLGLSVYWGGGSVSLQTCNGTNYFSNGHADYIKFSFTVTSSQASGSGATNAWLNIYNSVGYVAGTLNMSIGAWKLEKGNIATSLLGDATKSYDCSGYGNDGTIISSLSLSSDSPRYNNSVEFNGTTGGILIENLNIGNIINTAITYSFWIKPNGENGARSVYFGSYSGVSFSIEKTTGNKLRLYWGGSPDITTNLSITDGEWQHIVITKNGTTEMKVYLNGSLVQTITGTFNNLTFPTTFRIGRDTRSNDGTPYKGLMSDFRIYSTALSEDDIKELYNTGTWIDNKYSIGSFEFDEINSGSTELNPYPYAIKYSGSGTYTLKYLPNGDFQMTGYIWPKTDLIPINPTGKTYYYDIEYSNVAGNRLYVGFEKYDANKGTGANNECQYVISTTSAANHVRATGTVNLSTANGNTAAYTKLRLLNNWDNASGNMIGTIHHISLKEVSTRTVPDIKKTGVFEGDSFIEDSGSSISKTGNIIANQLIEI